MDLSAERNVKSAVSLPKGTALLQVSDKCSVVQKGQDLKHFVPILQFPAPIGQLQNLLSLCTFHHFYNNEYSLTFFMPALKQNV